MKKIKLENIGNKLLSLILVLTMVLGFLPTGLFPHALATGLTGNLGTTVGDISLEIDSKTGKCTITVSNIPTGAETQNTAFVVLPAFHTGIPAHEAAGKGLTVDKSSYNNLLSNYGSYLVANAPYATYQKTSTDLSKPIEVNLQGYTGDLMDALSSFDSMTLNGVAPENQVYTYLLLFVTGASNLQWTYATIAGSNPANLTVTPATITLSNTANTIADYSLTLANNGGTASPRADARVSATGPFGYTGNLKDNVHVEWVKEDGTRADIKDPSNTASEGVAGDGLFVLKIDNAPGKLGYGLNGTVKIAYQDMSDPGTAEKPKYKYVEIEVKTAEGDVSGSAETITMKQTETKSSDKQMTIKNNFTDSSIAELTLITTSDAKTFAAGNASGNLGNVPGEGIVSTDLPEGVTVKVESNYHGTIDDSEGYYMVSGGRPIANGGSIKIKIWAEIESGKTVPAGTYSAVFYSGWGENGDIGYAGFVAVPITVIIEEDQTTTEKPTTVTYNGNKPEGAAGTVGNVPGNGTWAVADKGTAFTLSSNIPTLDGYAFEGWKVNNTGTTYAAEGKLPASLWSDNGTVTLYAQWKKLAVVTFNPNGGNWDDSTDNKTATVGTNNKVDSSDIPANPSRADSSAGTKYSFKGWYTDATGGSAVTVASQTFTSDTILYAQWNERYTVKFDLNGGSGAIPDSITQGTVGGSITLPASTGITKTDCIFKGWKADSDTTATGAGKEYIPQDSVTMKAQWAAVYALIFDANKPAGVTDNITGMPEDPDHDLYENLEAGKTVAKPPATPTLKGYKFGGWAESDTSKTEVSWPITINGNKTVYAIWTELPAVDKASGTTASGGNNPKPGEDYTLSSITLTDSTTLTSSGHWIGTDDWIKTAEWYLGGSSTKPNGEPNFKGEVLASNADHVPVPTTAAEGDCLWVKLGGDGTNVKTDEVWIKFDIGEDKFSLNVSVQVLDKDGNAVTKPANITATGTANLAAKATQTISTTSVNNSYDFLGWIKESDLIQTKEDGSTAIKADYADHLIKTTYPDTSGKWKLDSFDPSPIGKSGMNSAVFTAPDAIGSNARQTLYAVYKAVPTYSLTVTKDNGIDKVEVLITRDGKTTKLSPDSGTNTYSGIRATDTVTITSVAKSTHVTDGFNPGGADSGGSNEENAPTGLIYDSNSSTSTLVLHISDPENYTTATIKAISKEKEKDPAKLTLTPTAGKGTTSAVTTSPKATVTNVGGKDATEATVSITGVTVDGAAFGTGAAGFTIGDITGSKVEPGTAKKQDLTITPPSSGLTAGKTYYITVQVSYKDGKNDDAQTVSTVVGYTVDAIFDGKVIVKKDGTPVNGAVVTLTPGTGLSATTAGTTGSGASAKPKGEASFTGLTIGTDYAITVDLDGDGSVYTAELITPDKLTNSSTNHTVTVNFYTITVNHANTTVDQTALDNTNAKVTLSLSKSVKADAAGDANSANKSAEIVKDHITDRTAKAVVQAGAKLTLTSTPANLKTGYVFKDWTNGTATSTDSAYTITVTKQETYTASLKKSDASVAVVTYNTNVGKAPHIKTPNPTIDSIASQIGKTGETIKLTLEKPELAGYVFKGWATTDTGAVAYQPGDVVYLGSKPTTGAVTDKVLDLNNEDKATLYAVWEDDTITLDTTSLPNGEYGKTYSATTVAAHSASGEPVTVTLAATGSGYKLPGGLTIDGATVKGKPYEVTSDGKVKVTAALATDHHADGYKVGLKITSGGSTLDHKDLTFSVAKATPVVTKVAISNVQSGGPIADASYTITVEGPRYKGGASAGASADNANYWENYTDTLHYNTTSNKTSGIGAASSFTSDNTADNSKFKTLPASTKVTLTFVPGTTNTAFDGSATAGTAGSPPTGNSQGMVWNSANGSGNTGGNFDVKISTDGGNNFRFTDSWLYAEENTNDPAHQGYTVDATKTDGYVTGMDAVAGVVNAKDFVITAAGDQPTGVLTATLGKGNSSPFAIVGSLGNDYITSGTTNLAVNGTTKIRVKVKDGLDKSTYTDTLTITGANGGKAYIKLTFVVTDPLPFDAYITVATTDKDSATGTTLPDNSMSITVGGKTATLVPNDATGTDASYKGKYKVTGLAVGTDYSVTVNGTAAGGYTIPSVTISAPTTEAPNNNKATVTLYEIATAYTGIGGSGTPNQSGAGWYVSGQSAKITTDAAVVSGTTTYKFINWTYPAPTETDAGATGSSNNNPYSFTVSTAKTYTANYKGMENSTTITYYRNDGTASPNDVVATETVTKGTAESPTTQAVIHSQPTRDGYVFKYWTAGTEDSGTHYGYESGETGTVSVVATPIKLYAQWEPAQVLAPTGDGADDWKVTPPGGVYGTDYSYTVPMPRTTDNAGVTFSATGLPGGLYIDKDTGVISGKPYEVGTVNNVTITATHKILNGKDGKAEVKLVKENISITIDKYQLQFASGSPTMTNVVPGQNVNTGSYTGTIVAPPLYNGKDTDGKTDKWTTFTGGTAHLAAQDTDKGTLTLTTAGTFVDGTNTVGVQYDPSTTEKDAADNAHNAIYKPATGVATTEDKSTFSMTVQTTPVGGEAGTAGTSASHEWKYTESSTDKYAELGYTVDGTPANGATTAAQVNKQTFTLTNTGSLATGKLDWKWGSTGTDESKFFTLGAADGVDLTASLPAPTKNESGTITSTNHYYTFTIVPKEDLPTYNSYTDILTITNKYGGSVTVTVTFKVVNPATYDADITTLLQSVANYQANPQVKPAADQLPAGNVVLKPVGNVADNGGEKTGFYDSTNKKYVFNTSTTGKDANALTYGESYTVCVNGYDVPGIVISNTDSKRSATVTLFEVTVEDDASTSVSKASSVSKAYVVKGENVTVTIGTAEEGYSFSKLERTTNTDGDLEEVAGNTISSYTQAVTGNPLHFVATFVAGLTLSFDGNGKTAGDPPADQTHAAGDKVILPGQNTLEKSGYIFKGWGTSADTTSSSATGFYNAGAEYTMPDDSTTLYAVWEAGEGGFHLTGETITVYYGESVPSGATLSDNILGSLTGDPKYEITSTLNGTTGEPAPLNPDKWTNILAVNEDSGAISGTTKLSENLTKEDHGDSKQLYKEGPFEIGVKLTDKTTNTAATATVTVKVEKAKTEVDPANEPALKSDVTLHPGDTFTVDDLDPDKGLVDAMKHGKTTHTADDVLKANVPGEWSLADGETGKIGQGDENGKQTIKLKFTPYDKGFEPTEYDFVVDVTEKKIASVTVGIAYPTSGVAPNKDGTPKVVTATANSPTINANKPGDYVDIASGDVAWTGGVVNDVFDTTQAITVIVRVTTKDGWTFVDKEDLEAALRPKTATDDSQDKTMTQTPAVEILTMNTEHTEAFIRYTFEKENTPIQKVNVNPGSRVVGAHTTTWSVNTEDAPKYYVETKETTFTVGTGGSAKTETVQTKWLLNSDGSEVTAEKPFAETKENSGTKAPLYDAVVVIKAQTGYEFDPAVFAWDATKTADQQVNLCEGNTSANWKATANDKQPPEGAHTARMQYQLSNDKKTLVIRYNSFDAVNQATSGISVKGSAGVYYAQTADNAEHYNASAKGNATDKGFVFDNSGIEVYPIYADGSVGTNKMTTGYEIGKGNTDATFVPLTNGYSFKNGYSSKNDVADWDGQTLYVKIKIGETTTYTAVPGTLTVKKLEATSISITNAPSMKVTVGDKLTEKTGDNATAVSVDFNAGVTGLDNKVSSGLTAGSKPTTVTTPAATNDYRPNYYYMLDDDNDGKITDADTPLVTGSSGTAITAAMHGKAVYVCYTDVNGNLVYTRIGVLGASSEFTVTVTDENGHDPEYQDKLTATPSGDGPYDYQWEKFDPDDKDDEHPDGKWKPIPGATSPDYRPDKDKIEETIRVVVTDKTTGTEVPGDKIDNKPIVIQPRSINFTVDVKDKRYDGNANNTWTYVAADFHPTAVTKDQSFNGANPVLDANGKPTFANAAKSYGGVWGTDTVTITPAGAWNNADTTRPPYANANVNSEITWPAVTKAGSNVSKDDTEHQDAASKIAEYTVAGTMVNKGTEESPRMISAYRLAPQDIQDHRGKITDGTVTHVDVSFKEVPTFDHVIPGAPMGVTDSRETQAGESTGGQTYTATWYTGVTDAKNFDPTATSLPNGVTKLTLVSDPATKYGAAGYTVVVKVRPQAGYSYNLTDDSKDKTKFYFHFGELLKEEVTQVTNGVKGLKTVKEDGVDVYYMWYTFTEVTYPKIAHVNVSIPQPIVEKTSAQIGTAAVNQAIHTDNTNNKDHVTLGTVTWYEGETGTTAPLGTNAFEAGKVYRAEFDLTAADPYKYVNVTHEDATQDPTTVIDERVTFIVSGVGPIEGAGSGTNLPAAIKSVTTSLPADGGYSADTKYHVVIVFNELKGGKVAVTDVVVDASVPAVDVEKTGPEVTGTKPYALTTTTSDGNTVLDTANNKWEYWNASKSGGAGWDTVSDGNGAKAGTGANAGKLYFIPGTDYRVTAKVKQTNTTNYQITTDTKFYLAGEQVSSTTAVSGLHGNYIPLNPSAAAASGVYGAAVTFTLIREFSTPSGIVDITDISVTYPEPVSEKNPAADPSNYANKDQVVIAAGSDTATTGTKWYTTNLSAAPADRAAIEALTTSSGLTAMTLTGSSKSAFADGTYYMVETKISSKDSSKYVFVTDNTGDNVGKNTRVNINGVIVNVGGPMGIKYDSNEATGKKNEIGWAIATANADGTITAKYIAKTAALDKIITSVTTGVTAPSAGAAKNDTAHAKSDTTQALNGSGYIVTDLGLVDGGDVTATWAGTFESTNDFKKGESYTVTYTLTTKDGYTFLHGIKDGAIEKHAAFVIQGVTVDTWEIKDGKVTGTGTKGSGDDALTVEVTELTTTTAQIKITYPKVGDDESIQQVTVDYTAPKEGDAPAKSTIYTPTAQVKLGATKGSDPLEYNDLNDDRTVGSTWFDASTLPNSGNGMATDGSVKFDNGDYVVLAHFTANDGFKFTDDTTFTVNGTTYKKEASNSHVTIATGGKSATVWHTFSGLDKEIVKVETSVAAPIATKTPASAVAPVALNKSNVNLQTDALTIGAVTWTGGGKTLSGSDTFAYDTAYTATYTLTVNTGYTYRGAENFVDFIVNNYADHVLNVKDDAETTIDAKNTSVSFTDGDTTVTVTKTSDKVYTVKITFPKTGVDPAGRDKEIVKVITSVTKPVSTQALQTKADTTLAENKDQDNLLPTALTGAGKTTVTWYEWDADNGAWSTTAVNLTSAPNAKYSMKYKAVFDLPVATGYTYRAVADDATTDAVNEANYVDFIINSLKVKNGLLVADTTEGSAELNVKTHTTAGTGETAYTEVVYADAANTIQITLERATNDSKYTVTVEFLEPTNPDPADREVVKVVTSVPEPVALATPATNAHTTEASNKSNENLLSAALVNGGNSSITWTDDSGNSVDKFAYSTKYIANFDVTVNTSGKYNYRKDTTTPNFVDFLVNGYTDKTTTGKDKLNVKNDTAEDEDSAKVYKTDVIETAAGAKVTLTRTSDTVYHVKIEFPATNAKPVDDPDNEIVKVRTFVNKPEPNGLPQGNAITDEALNKPESGSQNLLSKALADGGNSATTWYKGSVAAANKLSTGATFEYDTKYIAEYTLTVSDGYSYRAVVDDPTTADVNEANYVDFQVNNYKVVDTDGSTVTKALLNAKNHSATTKTTDTLTDTATGAKVTIIRATDNKSYKVQIEFPAIPSDKTIIRVAANATQPVAGANIPTGNTGVNLLLAQDVYGKDWGSAKVGINNVSWTVDGATATGKFEKGKVYTVSFDVTATDAGNGYIFKQDAAPKDYVDFLINSVTGTDGKWIDGDGTAIKYDITVTTAHETTTTPAETEGGDPTVTHNYNKYTVTVTFPETEDKADVLTVWGLAAPKAGDPISASNLKVPANEPYKIVSGDTNTMWQHWDLKDSSDPTQGYEWKTVTSGTFLPGHTYKAVIKTELKTTGDTAGKYQFTSTTDGYVNDTTAYNNKTDNTMEGTKVTYTAGSGTDDNPQYITIERVFPIDATTVEVHVASDRPAKDAEASAVNGTIKVPDAYKDYYKLLDASDTIEKAWYEENGTTKVTTFAEGKTYKLIVNVVAEEGYKLPNVTNKTQYIWDTNNAPAIAVAANGQTADGKDIHKVTFTYYIAKEGESKSPELAVDIPKKGGTPAKPTSPNDSVKFDEYKWTEKGSGASVTTFTDDKTYVVTVFDPKKPDGTPYAEGDKIQFNEKTATVTKVPGDDTKLYVDWEYRIPKEQTITQTGGGGGGGGGGTTVIETPVVTYALRDLGVTLDLTAEKVKKNQSPKAVPKVEGITGLKFVGWSETDPSKLKDGKLPTLVDPKTFKITDDKTFYAVYEKLASEFDHTHYVIGFPDGTFGPDHNITRGQVATIIARSCLENFIEGSNYGNPGNYTDVESHWAFSAISYCSMNGVFTGYGDGTFRPDQPITRQELATVVARLAGVQVSKGLPFSDAGDIASWALNGVYTNYANGWVNGYTDGTFKPLNDISRAETVKIFNGYLTRGTDKEGLSELREYVHSGVASNNTENGKDEYMTWPDVAKTHWAYYEIIEAANDHNFHWRDLEKETPPEDWYECYIDEKWRYNDNANDGPDDVGRQDTLPTLTVTYVVQSNGVVWDSITEEVTQYSSPDPAKLPQAVPSEGFRFAGWSETDPDTGVVTLIDPTAHPVLENKTFYAVFERDVPAELPNVTITYVIGDHGSTDMALTETIKMWESPTVEHLPKIAAHEGWRFAGWSETDPAAGTVTLTDPTDHPALADATFYAVYEQEKAPELPPVTVTYVIGGQGSTQAALTETLKQYESPTVAGLPQVTANEGWTFLGWSETDPASGAWALVDPTAVSILADKSFYAVYEAVQPQQPEQPGETQQPEQPEQPGETQQPEQPEQPVEYARYSYINGYTDNTFRPDAAFTRAAVATVIANLKGYDPNASYEGYAFDDLDGHWGANAIAFCVSQGLMSGYTDNTFRPDNAISRQEFAVVLCRLAGKSESGELPFTDVDSIASWALDSVYTAYANGWINGYDDGSFLPERDVTRAEAVKMFNGYLGRSADRESIESQTGYTVWEDVPETHWAYFEIIEASNSWAK